MCAFALSDVSELSVNIPILTSLFASLSLHLACILGTVILKVCSVYELIYIGLAQDDAPPPTTTPVYFEQLAKIIF